jgi:acyl carrier protein
MNSLNVESRVKHVFANIFPVDETSLTATTGPDEIESWDSLKHMSLVAGLESEFQISFEIEEIMQLENVGTAITIVRGKVGELL